MVDSTQSYEHALEAAGTALAAGDRPTAERAFRAAIRAIEGVEGGQLELASTLIRLGSLKQEAGSFEEAEELFRRALNVTERALGPEDLGLVPALTGLGASRILRGAPDEAAPVIDRALTIGEKKLGASHPDLVILLNDVTRMYLKQSAFTFAEPLLMRLLAIKRGKGEDHPEVATVLASLAQVHQALGRHEKAEQLWRRVLSIREQTLAPNHFAIATAFEHLADTCAARGKVREALQLFQRALAIRELTLGAEHASLRSSRERIADLQLQASEDSHDAGDAIPATPNRYRLPSGQPLGYSVSVVPAPERAVAPPHREMASPPPPTARMAPPTPTPPPMAATVAFEEEDFSTPDADEPSAEATAQAKAVPYLNTLLAIQDELEEDGEPAASAASFSDRASAMVAAAGVFIRQRRAAVLIGVGALALPLVAVAMRSRPASGWVEQASVAQAPRRDSIVVSAAPDLLVRPQGAPIDPLKDGAGSSTKTVAAARANEEKKADEQPAFPSIGMPTVSQSSVGRLDSAVRALTTPVRSAVESLPAQLGLGRDNTASPRQGATFFETVGTPVRARLVGELPTPRYPAQLLAGGVGGEVKVRFDVDTAGRPMMSSFSVVSSPHSLLTAAVRKIVPAMRFEPARSAAPDSRPMIDRIEMAFQFAPPPR